jgi:hypothetical protein
MLSIGKNIRQANDPLIKINIEQLARKIQNPEPAFVDYIQQLRKIISIDTKKYRELKTRLPYVVAAIFQPPFRKIENFASSVYFILDVDHLSEKEINIDQLFGKLKEDPHIVLMFRSPSNDGLKLFFKTNIPFRNAGKYTLFYKTFAQNFSTQYAINQVVDKRTSDVSRACFVSYDPAIWYNRNAEPVIVERYINFDDQLQIAELENYLKEQEKEKKPEASKTDLTAQDLDSDIIRQIRERLNPKLKAKREKQIYVPEELNQILDIATNALQKYGFEVQDVVNIHYGKQFRLKYKHLKAEVNVFYGKKGFSIVKSTKSGMNAELVDVAHEILTQAILF